MAERIEEIEYNGSRQCWKYDPKDPENRQIWIQESEYMETRDSYRQAEFPFGWKEITA